MNLVDELHAIAAALTGASIPYAVCGGVAVTAAVDRVDFHEPIHVGELLHVVARIVYVGRSSMEVEITRGRLPFAFSRNCTSPA